MPRLFSLLPPTQTLATSCLSVLLHTGQVLLNSLYQNILMLHHRLASLSDKTIFFPHTAGLTGSNCTAECVCSIRVKTNLFSRTYSPIRKEVIYICNRCKSNFMLFCYIFSGINNEYAPGKACWALQQSQGNRVVREREVGRGKREKKKD